MRKYILIALVAMIFISGCSNNSDNQNISVTNEPTSTENTEAVTATPVPTPEPTAEPMVFDISSISLRSLNGLLQDQKIPDETTQLVLVAVGKRYDKLYMLEKNSYGIWQVVHGPFDVQLGKNGLGKEEEGDGKSPMGIFELGYAFGKEGAPIGTTWPWRSTEKGDLWIEDVTSKYYNMFVQESSVEDADWKNYSNLNINAFERAVEIRYNSERVPGAGSAIFLHIWTSSKKDTNGCTAISRENIDTLISWLDPNANTMIAQLPYEVLGYGDLVYLSDYSSDIIADVKFASEDNIFGVQLDGYNDNQVITKEDVAKALVQVNDMLDSYGARLVVHEAYRPMDAFYQIEAWFKDSEDIKTKETYYNDKTKEELRNEYFSNDSNKLYIRGSVVNVSLADLYGEPLDMGSQYMVFDEYTSYICDGLSPEQIYNRELLHDAMIQAGFSSEENQWWKFEYNPYLYSTKYDETIE